MYEVSSCFMLVSVVFLLFTAPLIIGVYRTLRKYLGLLAQWARIQENIAQYTTMTATVVLALYLGIHLVKNTSIVPCHQQQRAMSIEENTQYANAGECIFDSFKS